MFIYIQYDNFDVKILLQNKDNKDEKDGYENCSIYYANF